LIFTLKSESIPPAFQLCRFPAKSDSNIILLLADRFYFKISFFNAFLPLLKGQCYDMDIF
jgi:hypothetical protein